MSGSLSIALSGLDAAQTGLDTVSENISNSSTPGYLKETASLVNQQIPGDAIGNGVSVAGVLQSTNSFSRQLELSANGSQSYANQLQSLLTSAQASFNEPSSSGIAEQLNTMYNDFSALADSPTQPASYAQVVASAQNVTTAINQAAQNLTDVYNQASSSASTLVTTINSQLQDVASLNTQIASTSTTPGASNTLVDKQNEVIDQLASELGVTTIPGNAGQTTLLIGGVALVQGGQASAIQFNPASNPISTTAGTFIPATITLASSGATVPVTNGTLGATLTVMNAKLPSYGADLNQVVSNLDATVNKTLRDGTSERNPGNPSNPTPSAALFTASPPSKVLNASTITVNPAVAANPSGEIAASSGPTYTPGDGSNAQAIANQQTSTTSTGVIANWATSVAQVGLDVQNASALATSATNTYNQAYSAEQSVSGVSVNSQLVNLVNYQQMYQASAKVISTVAATLQSLIQDV
jgi:flagellar hook-associated protein 1 FlgK